MRMHAQTAQIAGVFVVLPKQAPWLTSYQAQLRPTPRPMDDVLRVRYRSGRPEGKRAAMAKCMLSQAQSLRDRNGDAHSYAACSEISKTYKLLDINID
jgi:hypothetical protein